MKSDLNNSDRQTERETERETETETETETEREREAEREREREREHTSVLPRSLSKQKGTEKSHLVKEFSTQFANNKNIENTGNENCKLGKRI